MNVAAAKPEGTAPTILIASDNIGDASMVQKLVEAEFEGVVISTHPHLVVQDFDRHAPEVLLLAFDQLEKAELYYLGLYRQSAKIHLQPHRTVVLCSASEVAQAYQVCKKEYFDDYVLFWPMTHDAQRLRMAVHHALRALAGVRRAGPSVAEFAAQARQLAGLGSLLDKQLSVASEKPAGQWADEFRKEYTPHMESVRNLNALADSIVPVILVVDDDPLERQLVATLLEPAGYRLVFASGGVEALNILSKTQPDLVLMDVMMPQLDGIETTRRLKASPKLSKVPVIMVTGQTEGVTVRDSLRAGAINFLVKPFDRETLLAKVARALRPAET